MKRAHSAPERSGCKTSLDGQRLRLMERTLRALRQRQAERRKRNRELWGEEVLFVDRLALTGASALAGEAVEWAAAAGLDALILDESLAHALDGSGHALLTICGQNGTGGAIRLPGGMDLLTPTSVKNLRPALKARNFGIVLGQAPTGYWGMDSSRAEALAKPFQTLRRWRKSGKKPVALGFSNASSPYAMGAVWTALLGASANANSPKAVARGLAHGNAAFTNGPLLDLSCGRVPAGGSIRRGSGRVEIAFRAADHRGLASVRCFAGDAAMREFPARGRTVLDVVFLIDLPRSAPFVRLDCSTLDGCWAFTNPVWVE